MQYDLLIQNGTLVDGSGMPRFQADVGIVAGKIAAIGKIRDSAKEVIDAEGHVVAPGFIDGHTQRGDGELRFFACPVQRREQTHGDAQPGTGRRYFA